MVDRNYITAQQLRVQLGDGTTQKLDAVKIDWARGAAARAIDRRTGRRFYVDDVARARTFRPTDPYTAWVNDIATTDDLVIKTGSGGTYGTTIAPTSYELGPRDDDADDVAYAWWSITLLDGSFPRSGRHPTLQVTAKWGWSAIPEDVSQACLLLAASLHKRAEATFGVAGFGEFGAVRIREDSDVKALIAPFIKIGFGG